MLAPVLDSHLKTQDSTYFLCVMASPFRKYLRTWSPHFLKFLDFGFRNRAFTSEADISKPPFFISRIISSSRSLKATRSFLRTTLLVMGTVMGRGGCLSLFPRLW